jgi:hypothetical protein
MVVARHAVGRLIEVRVAWPIDIEEIHAGRRAMVETIASIEGQPIFVFDLRALSVVPSEGADATIGFMRADNARTLRAAFLVAPENATMAMQAERIVRSAGSASRRVFREIDELEGWLRDVVTPEEALAVHAGARRASSSSSSARSEATASVIDGARGCSGGDVEGASPSARTPAQASSTMSSGRLAGSTPLARASSARSATTMSTGITAHPHDEALRWRARRVEATAQPARPRVRTPRPGCGRDRRRGLRAHRQRRVARQPSLRCD